MSLDIKKRIEELSEIIEYHNKLYYDHCTIEISDAEYDILMKELYNLEIQYPEYKTEYSPTNRVAGYVSDGFNQVKHKYQMLSIDNCFSYDDIKEFDSKCRKLTNSDISYITELKLDGLAISLQYEQGILKRAVTRGNGFEGDDVTNNIKILRCVPLRLPDDVYVPPYLEVRGEVTMSKSELERLNSIRANNGHKLLANCRNAAAGSLKQLDTKEFKKRKLYVTVYDMFPQLSTRLDILSALESYGFKTNNHTALCSSVDQIEKYCNYWYSVKHNLDYDIDGVVIKINDINLCDKIGCTSHAPRHMVAYKFPAEIAVTKLIDITVQVGKSGILTPVAELAPVRLCGTIVKRATLHNFDMLSKMGLRIGDFVKLQKAGEIIPQIIGFAYRDSENEEFQIPSNCPSCGSTVEKDEGGVFIRCTGSNCMSKIAQTIEHFASKPAMNIDGLGGSIVYQLVENNVISTPSDLYYIDYDRLYELDRMGEKKINNLRDAIEKSKSNPFERVLIGLNIPNIGRHLSPILAKTFKSIDGLKNASKEELISIPEIGDLIAEDLIAWFSNEHNIKLIEDLRTVGIKMEYEEIEKENVSNKLKGMKLIATGKLQNYSRKGIEDAITENGGIAVSSVTSDTNYLIVGEKPGSKLQKAESLGIKIINEHDFISMIS